MLKRGYIVKNEWDVPQVKDYIVYELSKLSPAELRCLKKILKAIKELREEQA
jgi:hypothetical protein